MNIVAPLLIGVLYVCLNSLIPDDRSRRRFNAVMIAGAGAAYISGGALGPWELGFTAVLAFVAYRGLESWQWIGVGWLLHTVWDVVHHLKGAPLLPFAADSSFGCAVCDPVIALWALTGGRAVLPRRRRRAASA